MPVHNPNQERGKGFGSEPMNKLINVWNGLAAFLGAMGGIFIILDHLVLGIIFVVVGAILALVPAASDIRELGKYHVVIIPGVALISLGILAYILFAPKPQTSIQVTEHGITLHKTDSSKVDSTKRTPKKKKPQVKTASDSILQLGPYLQSRANIEFSNIRFDKPGTEKPPRVTFEVHNSGPTPARKVSGTYGMKIGTGVYEADFVEADKIVGTDTFFVGPLASLPQECTFSRALRADELDLVLNSQKGLYFMATVTYRDDFGKPRYVKFGCQYDPKSGNVFAKYSDTK